MLEIRLAGVVELTSVNLLLLVISVTRQRRADSLSLIERIGAGRNSIRIEVGKQVQINEWHTFGATYFDRFFGIIGHDGPIVKSVFRQVLISGSGKGQRIGLCAAVITGGSRGGWFREIVGNRHRSDTFSLKVSTTFTTCYNRRFFGLNHRFELFAQERYYHAVLRHPFVVQSERIIRRITVLLDCHHIALGVGQERTNSIRMTELFPTGE